MRKTPLTIGEYYHIYNRGVDKRNIFNDQEDVDRFVLSINEFNVIDPIGSIYENLLKKEAQLGHPMSKMGDTSPLVSFVAYNLLPNHFHFIITPLCDNGIQKFMQKFGNGYTKYFNLKNKRSGSLFQGRFKSSHVNSEGYLLHLSAYVNLNNMVHKIPENFDLKLPNSFSEYCDINKGGVIKCDKDIILNQFINGDDYKKFAIDSLQVMLKRKETEKELKKSIFE